MARKFVVKVTVADLRRSPGSILPNDYSHQEMRETQLLFGEQAEMVEEREEWVQVAALEQLCFHETKGWHPYLGWILRSELLEVPYFETPKSAVCTPFAIVDGKRLSYGTLLPHMGSGLRALAKRVDRNALVEEARYFLEAPYLWGGRSAQLTGMIASVDCSGLINLLYRAQGVYLPRNAHEQYLRGKPTSKLNPGDPLYLAKGRRIGHVVLKLDDKTFIESPESGKKVRCLKWGEQIWEEDGKIRIFDRPSPYHSYPVSFIPS